MRKLTDRTTIRLVRETTEVEIHEKGKIIDKGCERVGWNATAVDG